LLEAQDRLAGTHKKAILLQARVELHSTHATRQAVSKNVASEDFTSFKIGRDGGAQEAECTRQYMSILSTAGAQDVERSSFLAPR
jgi:hypothetical protein